MRAVDLQLIARPTPAQRTRDGPVGDLLDQDLQEILVGRGVHGVLPLVPAARKAEVDPLAGVKGQAVAGESQHERAR